MKKIPLAIQLAKHYFMVTLVFQFNWQVFSLRYLLQRKSHVSKVEQPKIIISLTSYRDRFQYTHKTIRSLMMQNHRDMRIILFLEKHDFAQADAFSDLLKFDFRVEEFAYNYRSYIKFVPAFERYPNAIIVTADDDMYYRKSWLQELVAAHQMYPSSIVGHRGLEVGRKQGEGFTPYKTWPKATAKTSSSNLLLTGVGGVLYPPGILKKEVLDMDLAMRLTANNDDIWLFFMSRLSKCDVRVIETSNREPYFWFGSQNRALRHQNVANDYNDVQMMQMERFFQIFKDNKDNVSKQDIFDSE